MPCQKEDIPTMIIKLNEDLIVKFISHNFDFCIGGSEFSFELKHANFVPIHKKKDKSDKVITEQ